MYGTPRIEKRPAEENEDWHLTLADMMTLLLCFFVLIVAISSIDKERYKVITDVMGAAMGSKIETEQKKKKSLTEIMQEIEEIIGAESSTMQLELRTNAVAINLMSPVFFELGNADLTEEAISMLSKITNSLIDIPYRITVEGHTDNIPIKSIQFPSNWELSSARASAVARFIINNGFPKDKIQVLGLADTKPFLPNEDKYGQQIPENQAKNRRVVILVTP